MAGDSFRGELVERLDLTEASISRIVAELKSEDLVSEYSRRPAPYPGGPTNVVAINWSIRVAGVELANGRVSAGIGTLGGEIQHTHRCALSPNPDSAEVERAVASVTRALSKWARRAGVSVRQVSVALPGFGSFGDINPIIPTSIDTLRSVVAEQFDGVPIAFTNSVQAQAAQHGFGIQAKSQDRDHLFLFVGHGIGATRIGDTMHGAEHRTVEIGHMIMDRAGPLCRCGHRGCLEAYAGLPAVAAAFDVSEERLLAAGDHSFDDLPLTGPTRGRIEDMLRRIGQALGNTLNVDAVGDVVIAGWPTLVPAELRALVLDELDASLLGGIERCGIEVTFIPPLIGNDPMPAICYAAYAFVQRGAMDIDNAPAAELPRRRRASGSSA